MRNFMASVSAIGAALGLVTALVALFSGAPGEVTSITFASAFALAVIYVLMDLAEEIHQYISSKQPSEKSIGVPGSSEPVEDGTLKELKPANVIAGRPSLIARPRHNRAHWASSPFLIHAVEGVGIFAKILVRREPPQHLSAEHSSL